MTQASRREPTLAAVGRHEHGVATDRLVVGRRGDDADVAVEQPELVVVLGHEDRPPDVPFSVEPDRALRGE